MYDPSATYYPPQWYWLADDGRVYSGPLQAIVSQQDPGYVAWIEPGRVATAWPRDLAGNQTDAALQQVLEQHDMFVNLNYYTVNKRWQKEQGGIVATAGFPIKTNDRAQAKITGIYAASKEAPSVTTPFHAADNTVHELTAAQMYELNSDLLTHINNCFAISADVLADIQAGTITTREQVDAAFDAPITQARKDWMKTG